MIEKYNTYIKPTPNTSDEDGSYGSALEHGGLFDNLKHIVISNH